MPFNLRHLIIAACVLAAVGLPLFHLYVDPSFEWGAVLYLEAFIVPLGYLVIRNKAHVRSPVRAPEARNPPPSVISHPPVSQVPKTVFKATPGMIQTMASPQAAPAVSRGVGGWLLLFCLSLVVFNPAGLLFRLAPHFQAMTDFSSKISWDTLGHWADVAIVGYGAYAGILLWSKKLEGVQSAKNFLVLYAAAGVLIPIALAVAVKSQVPEILATDGRTIFSKLLYAVVWYSYLVKSKRVRETYEDPSAVGFSF